MKKVKKQFTQFRDFAPNELWVLERGTKLLCFEKLKDAYTEIRLAKRPTRLLGKYAFVDDCRGRRRK